MHILLGPAPAADDAAAGHGPGTWRLVRPEAPDDPADGASPVPRRFREVPWEQLGEAVRATLRSLPAEEAGRIRWVLPSCREVMPQLLASGVSPDRCWDLALCQRILTGVASFPDGTLDYTPTVPLDPLQQERPPGRLPAPRADPAQTSLFDAPAAPRGPARPDAAALAAEFRAQEAAVRASPAASRLRLLLAAESQGGLIAQEIEREGLPWDRAVHEALLEDLLGPRPPEGKRPQKMQALAERIAEQWGLPKVNPDSPQELLRAMQSVGITVDSTRKHALLEWAEHGGTQAPRRREMIAPVLEYKGLYRLWTANGWHWLDEWVRDGRFHARYVVGGVVTGRWAAHGGGALQIPHAVRDAVRADPGWVLTVADASQVEPRILAAMAQDRALAVAGQGRDLYEGIARLGERTGSALTERKAAKVALLGAMYGASTGEAGALVPHLRRMFPEAIGLVEQAASVGERGGQVRTWLGRTSPLPDADWSAAVADVSTAAAEARSVRLRRAQGRFTRNFIVQGTAAEWALCWMGEIRRRLRGARTGTPAGPDGAEADDAPGPLRTRLVFFVHDEVVLHGPAEEAPAVRAIVREAAAAAGRLLFGQAPVEFPLTVAQVSSYAEAK
ncbi:MAG: bifunctional 3'-5' exonuclease/DNA polymerase [Actinomycetia bacterium]|nr:bifunctional 3'-5' exonuclease/DNA polymerase [Actinomycetes bacterium]